MWNGTLDICSRDTAFWAKLKINPASAAQPWSGTEVLKRDEGDRISPQLRHQSARKVRALLSLCLFLFTEVCSSLPEPFPNGEWGLVWRWDEELFISFCSHMLDKLQLLTSEGRKGLKVTQNISQEYLCIILESQWELAEIMGQSCEMQLHSLHNTGSSWGLNSLCWIGNNSKRVKYRASIICKLP